MSDQCSSIHRITGSCSFDLLSCAQEAHKAIPRGTLLANAICTLTYMLVAWICAFSIERDVLLVPAVSATAAATTTSIYSYLPSSNASLTSAAAGATSMAGSEGATTAAVPVSVCPSGERCRFGLLHSSQVCTYTLLCIIQ